ncbi:hypothetical protein F4775DRAFT_597298 [Biscogniauxia sp. FL1348]|nr:hypothetical protein F4775DRAFT_597298 [Biscogniauxia sp. FL1348]
MASPNYNQYPLPAPPQPVQQQLPSHLYKHQSHVPHSQKPAGTRPRSRGFSFRSDKSQKSAGDNHPHKADLHETSAEKEAKRLHGKADPRMALSEIEPGTSAGAPSLPVQIPPSMQAQVAGEVATVPLRAIQHKDANGNPITEPDRSNPTRSRWERPLDTIRSFEAAIDGGYNRKSLYRADTDSVANWNRRASYYGSEHECTSSPYPNFVSHMRSSDNGPRFPHDSYYGGRASTMYDPRQSAMMGGPREGFQGGYDGDPYGNNGMGSRNRYSRMHSDPHMNGRGHPERNVYPMPNNHQSYETVASGTGSGSMGEPAGYQTDPTSSENSSIDRRLPPKRQEPMNDYGISFGQSPSYQPDIGVGNNTASAPAVPKKNNSILLRKPSKASNPNENSQERQGAGEKRKSWFLRRFSKS